MSIDLHCPKCTKLIRAPDSAGGKHGKCPYCKESVYVPTPPDQVEEIGVAPLDEDAERHAEELRRESLDYVASIGHASENPSGADRGAQAPGQVVDIGTEVEAYILAMRDSKLDDAERIVARLKRTGHRARDYVEALSIDEMPPEIENVPPPLIQAFLKKLLDRLR